MKGCKLLVTCLAISSWVTFVHTNGSSQTDNGVSEGESNGFKALDGSSFESQGSTTVPTTTSTTVKPTATTESTKKKLAALASIKTFNPSLTKLEPEPPKEKTCSSADLCETMRGICNNGTCEMPECSTEIRCVCYKGYTGQFCDKPSTREKLNKEHVKANGVGSKSTTIKEKGNKNVDTVEVNGDSGSVKADKKAEKSKKAKVNSDSNKDKAIKTSDDNNGAEVHRDVTKAKVSEMTDNGNHAKVNGDITKQNLANENKINKGPTKKPSVKKGTSGQNRKKEKDIKVPQKAQSLSSSKDLDPLSSGNKKVTGVVKENHKNVKGNVKTQTPASGQGKPNVKKVDKRKKETENAKNVTSNVNEGYVKGPEIYVPSDSSVVRLESTGVKILTDKPTVINKTSDTVTLSTISLMDTKLVIPNKSKETASITDAPAKPTHGDITNSKKTIQENNRNGNVALGVGKTPGVVSKAEIIEGKEVVLKEVTGTVVESSKRTIAQDSGLETGRELVIKQMKSSEMQHIPLNDVQSSSNKNEDAGTTAKVSSKSEKGVNDIVNGDSMSVNKANEGISVKTEKVLVSSDIITSASQHTEMHKSMQSDVLNPLLFKFLSLIGSPTFADNVSSVKIEIITKQNNTSNSNGKELDTVNKAISDSHDKAKAKPAEK